MAIVIVNLDHYRTLPGGVGQSGDRAAVYGTETEAHPVTGKRQPRRLFSGTLAEAHRFVRDSASA